MKKLLSVFMIFMCGFILNAQSVPAKEKDNYTVQYLIVSNQKNEVLLMKNKLGWHTPAIRSNRAQSIKESLDSLAENIGIKIKDIRLSGLYVHKFEGLDDHPEISFRSHYTSQLNDEKDYQKIRTSSNADIEYHWVNKDDVQSLLHFDFLRAQTLPILESPSKVWGGTFLIIWKDDELQGSKIIEPIHILSD